MVRKKKGKVCSPCDSSYGLHPIAMEAEDACSRSLSLGANLERLEQELVEQEAAIKLQTLARGRIARTCYRLLSEKRRNEKRQAEFILSKFARTLSLRYVFCDSKLCLTISRWRCWVEARQKREKRDREDRLQERHHMHNEECKKSYKYLLELIAICSEDEGDHET